MTPGERAAERLIAMKDELAAALTESLYGELPHLMEKYGQRGRDRCHEDMRYNVEHLAPAVALGQPEMFASYVRWLDDLLRARNVATDDVVRSLELMRSALQERLPDDEAAAAVTAVTAGLAVLEVQ